MRWVGIEWYYGFFASANGYCQLDMIKKSFEIKDGAFVWRKYYKSWSQITFSFYVIWCSSVVLCKGTSIISMGYYSDESNWHCFRVQCSCIMLNDCVSQIKVQTTFMSHSFLNSTFYYVFSYGFSLNTFRYHALSFSFVSSIEWPNRVLHMDHADELECIPKTG